MTQLLCFVLVPIFYVSALIYGAQQRPLFSQPEAKSLRWLSAGLIGLMFLFGFSLIFWALAWPPAELNGEIDAATLDSLAIPLPEAVTGFLLVMFTCVAAAAALWSGAFREFLRRYAFRGASFRADLSTHVVPLILAFMTLALFFGSQAFNTNDLESGTGISVEQLLLQAVIFLACALLGVGYPMRRSERKTLARLGLRLLKREDWLFGLGIGTALLILTQLGSILWQLFLPMEEFAEQSAFARDITTLFSSLPLILLLATLTALSEEILFRGALQPVFGLLATSVFFALSHTQYGYTPALIFLFVVGAGLGFLRERYSTSAAIIAHFAYNFLQLSLFQGVQ